RQLPRLFVTRPVSTIAREYAGLTPITDCLRPLNDVMTLLEKAQGADNTARSKKDAQDRRTCTRSRRVVLNCELESNSAERRIVRFAARSPCQTNCPPSSAFPI